MFSGRIRGYVVSHVQKCQGLLKATDVACSTHRFYEQGRVQLGSLTVR